MTDWDKVVDVKADFDSVTDADVDMNDTVAAMQDGHTGLEITFDDTNKAFGTLDFLAVNQKSVMATFSLNLNDVALEATKVVDLCYVEDGGSQVNLLFRIFRPAAGDYQLIYYARNDGGTYDTIGEHDIDHAKWYRVEFFSKLATGAGANDGVALFYVDDTLAGSESTLDSDTLDYDVAHVGMVFSDSGTYSGSYYIDTIKIRKWRELVSLTAHPRDFELRAPMR
jgi:hypothetical protein